MAAEGGHLKVVEYLVDKNANINITDNSKVSYIASISGTQQRVSINLVQWCPDGNISEETVGLISF